MEEIPWLLTDSPNIEQQSYNSLSVGQKKHKDDQRKFAHKNIMPQKSELIVLQSKAHRTVINLGRTSEIMGNIYFIAAKN
mgnify:CR=1 FL=1